MIIIKITKLFDYIILNDLLLDLIHFVNDKSKREFTITLKEFPIIKLEKD